MHVKEVPRTALEANSLSEHDTNQSLPDRHKPEGTQSAQRTVHLEFPFKRGFWSIVFKIILLTPRKYITTKVLFGHPGSHRIVRQYNSMFGRPWNMLTWYLAHNVKRGKQET